MVTLYSTGCPNCMMLKKMLERKNIEYDIVSDIDEMERMGLKNAPWLDADGYLMDFRTAQKWISDYEKEE